MARLTVHLSYDTAGASTRPVRARLRRGATAGCLVLVCGWTTVSYANADELVASEPRNHQQLPSAPGWVTMAFDVEIDPGSAKVLVQDGKGRNVTAGPLIVEGTNVTSQLQDGLTQGTYTVRYRVRGSEELFGGAYQFAYGAGSYARLPDRTWSGSEQEPGVFRNDDPNAISPGPRPSAEPRTTVPGVELSRRQPEPDRSAPTPPRSSPTTAAPAASASSSEPTETATAGTSSAPAASAGATPEAVPAAGSGSLRPLLLAALGFLVAALIVVGTRASRARHRNGPRRPG